MSKKLSWLSDNCNSSTPAPPDNVELLVVKPEAYLGVWLRRFGATPPALWPGCERVLVGDGYVVDEVVESDVFKNWRYPDDRDARGDWLLRCLNERNLRYGDGSHRREPWAKKEPE